MPRKKKKEDEEIKEKKESKEKIGRGIEEKPKVKAKSRKGEGSDFSKTKGLLVKVDDYRKAGIYIGTRVITAHMKPYVYRRKADGLAIIDIEKTDEKLRAAINLLSQYKPKEIMIVCKREAGWKALERINELFGIKIFTRQYPAGIITNPVLEDFYEPKLIIVVDPWIDKKAISDGKIMNIPIISFCDTNNITHNIDLVIPTNNKSEKSISLLFYILFKNYMEKIGMKKEAKALKLEDFSSVEEK